jgi:hypothetical protein
MTLYSACALDAAQLAVGDAADLLGELGLVEALAQGGELIGARLLAELLLDRAHLLAQEHLALAVVEALAHLGVDLLAQLGHRAGLDEQAGHQAEAFAGLAGEEDLDLLLGVEAEGGGDAVGEQAGVIGAAEHLDPLAEVGDDLGGDLLQLLADLACRAPRRGRGPRAGW